MFLFEIGLSGLISKLSFISSTNLLFPFAKMVNSTKDAILLQFKNLKDGRELHSPLMV